MSSSSSASGIAPIAVPHTAPVEEFLFAELAVEAAPEHARALCDLVPHAVVPATVTALVVALYETLHGASLALSLRVFPAVLPVAATPLRFDDVAPHPRWAKAPGKEDYAPAALLVRSSRAVLCAGPAVRPPQGSRWRELTRGWDGAHNRSRRSPAAALCRAVGVVAALSAEHAERVVSHATVALPHGLAREEDAALWREVPAHALVGHLCSFLDTSEIPFSAAVGHPTAWAEHANPLPPSVLERALHRAVDLPPSAAAASPREVCDPQQRPIVPCVFGATSQLTHVDIGAAMGAVMPSAFSGCHSLRTLVLGDGDGGGPAAIRTTAFFKCGLEQVVLPRSVVALEHRCFWSNFELTRVDMGRASVAVIQSGAFARCMRLHTVRFPPTLEAIGPSAFSSCTSLAAADFRTCARLESIGEWFFRGCFALARLVPPPRPEAVLLAAADCFADCPCEAEAAALFTSAPRRRP